MGAYHRHLDLNAKLVTATKQEVPELLKQSDVAYEEYYRHISQDLTPHAQSMESYCIEVNQPTRSKFDFLFAYPIRVTVSRETVYNRLLELGVIASTLVSKWDHVPKQGFAVEHDFMDHHLLLPVRCVGRVMPQLREEGLCQ